MKMKADKIILLFVMIVIYSLISVIALYTPMHSDDFPYSLIGLNPIHHVNHYLTWSGRVTADYASTIILSFNNHTIAALLNSMGSALLIYNISMLPSAINKEVDYRRVTINAIIIFLVYWVSNPNLGQVMFWIVGSANYMWTSLFIVLFIRKAIEYRENNYNKYSSLFIISILGIVAGWSNENTCLTLVLCMLSISAYYRFMHGQVGKSLIFACVSSIIGASAMLLAPGNFARAAGKSLESWRETSLLQKIFKHLYVTMPDVFSHIWVSLALFMFACIAILVNKRFNCNKYNSLALMFFMAFLCANFIMVASPGYPPRAMNGQFIFLLCSFSIVLYNIGKMYIITSAVSIAVALFLFIPSYASMYLAYKQTTQQSLLRTQLIKEAKNAGLKDVSIPAFYFLGLMKDGDKFDTYNSPYMAAFYGMKKIDAYDAPFDYSVLLNKYNYNIDMDISGNIAKGIYSYNDPFRNESLYILEFKNKANVPYANDFMLFIKPIIDGKLVSKGTSLPMRTVNIGGRHFTYVRIKNLNYDKVEGISFGAYKRSSGEILLETKHYK